ncbi:hypothetical protein [Hymenobacter terrestris]|uniref:Uncharacterized protein n=1 Tax=Hymenobacter terrestris TaxID=2748310 RepID=A0ABX2Q8J6_9BACT|nr:hypothetical protein [Hymenobacter terrestris]NVO86552.1 hypothetical protein [Hymenobacter terrestris]
MKTQVSHVTEFLFRLHGGGASPTSFSAKEVAEIIMHLESAFKTLLEAEEGEKAEQFYISLVDVVDQSNGLRLVPNIPALFTSVFIAITTALAIQDYSGLPVKTIEDLQQVRKVIRTRGCEGDFMVDNQVVASIKPNTKIEVAASGIVRGETILYGEVTRIGGREPRARISLDTGQIIICNVKQAVARSLGAKLYSKVALKGYATWTVSNYELTDFQIESFTDYNPVPPVEAFDRLRDLLGTYWDEIEDVDSFLHS